MIAYKSCLAQTGLEPALKLGILQFTGVHTIFGDERDFPKFTKGIVDLVKKHFNDLLSLSS